MQRYFRNLKGVTVFAGLTLNTLFWIVPITLFAVIKLLLPLPPLRRWLTRMLMHMAEFWIGTNARMFAAVNDTHWDIRGLEQLHRDHWYLVVVNHQSWVDIVVLQTVFNRRIPLLKFFIKKQLMWFPFLGIGFWALDMPFMERHSKSYLARHPEKKGSDLLATRAACEKFRYTPTSVINFLEGTRFSEAKRKRRGSPYRNLLNPRAGGIALALSSMGDMFDSIVDVTLVYGSPVPKFWDLVCGKLDRVIVDIRCRPVEQWTTVGDYIGDREFRRRFHSWLAGIWAEKDDRIDALRAEMGRAS